MSLSLFALAAAAFGIGTTEFVVMGLLPEVAAELGVSIPDAGLIVTAYAVGVVIGAPVMAFLLNGLPRKTTLIGLIALFASGNVLCAVAPSYEFLIVARVATAFCHAAFFGIAALVALDLVPASRRGQAVALVFAGLTVANILGVPGGTALGQMLGWRATFWAVAAIGVLAIAAIIAWLPAGLASPRSDLAREVKVLARPQVLLAMSITVLTSASLFATFTFISPLLREVTGLSAETTTIALLLFGTGMTAGSFVGGRLADWKLMPAIIGMVIALIAVLAVFAAVCSSPAATLSLMFVWGLVIFSLAPALQLRVVNAAMEAPNVASTLNQAAFNLGNAGGAWSGSAALALGAGFAELPLLSIMLAGAALAVAVVSRRVDRAGSASVTLAPAPAGSAG